MELAIATIDVVDFAVPARHFNDVGIVAGNPSTLLTVYDCERGWEGLYWHTGGVDNNMLSYCIFLPFLSRCCNCSAATRTQYFGHSLRETREATSERERERERLLAEQN